MNLLDVAAVALLVTGLVAGVRSGAFPQLGGLLGALAGAAVALLAATAFRDAILSLDAPTRALLVIGGLVFAIVVGEVVGSTVGRAASSALGEGLLSTIDRAVGGVLGLVQAILVIWLVGSLLAIGPIPELAREAQRSLAVRATAAALPPVSQVAAGLGDAIDRSGIPDVFLGLEPFPAPSVDAPAEARARQIAGPAVASTVEVASEACAYELTGSGFVVRPGYVVTNAHVVAGATHTVVVLDGRTSDATVVLFDPQLDLALLHVPGLAAPPLRFATRDPARGTQGAALGHPGGGPLVVLPAAVAGTYTAEGRDLYGSSVVRRDIVEIRADITRGDSGGPLVLADGTVGGVVFAEARSEAGVGYALSPVAVATRIAGSVGRTTAASTGACIR